MSLWACPTHGLYGGDVFCPLCGGTGEYVTLSPLEPATAPTPEFLSIGRNPDLPQPSRFEPTTKKPGEYVLTGDGKLVMVGEGR